MTIFNYFAGIVIGEKVMDFKIFVNIKRMGPIMDNILTMSDEEFFSLRKKIKEMVDIEENATIQEKRAIYNNDKPHKEYYEACDIFEELAFVFSRELHIIDDIGEHDDYKEITEMELIRIEFC